MTAILESAEERLQKGRQSVQPTVVMPPEDEGSRSPSDT